MEGAGGPDRRRSGPTIYDVAAACGVAPSTVSRAFSRPGRVNAETAERIRRVAAEMGYRTNPLARALPTGRTSLLSIVVADVTNPFFFEIIRGAEETATPAGYTLLVADVRESAEAEREALERTLPLVEGVVLATSRLSDSSIRVAAKQRPTVVLNRVMTDIPSVVTDNARGMRRAVEHLAELGHTTVVYLAGPEASWADGMRWRSMREAAYELEIRVRRLGPFAPTQAGGMAAAQVLAQNPPSAVIAYNDLLAIGLMRGLHALGGRVPQDVSVVGFDNIFGADFCTPPLTTVAAPLHHLGSHAVRTLLEILRTGGRRPYQPPARQQPLRPALLPAQLVVRGSTARRARRRAWHRPAPGSTGAEPAARAPPGQPMATGCRPLPAVASMNRPARLNPPPSPAGRDVHLGTGRTKERTMTTQKRLLATAVVGVAALTLTACGGDDGGNGAAGSSGGKSMRLALNQTEQHPSYIALDNFSERLSEGTDGRWSIDVFPNETLGAQQEALQLVSDGTVDMAIVSGTQLENLNQDFLVFNLPQVFDSVEHQMSVIHDEEIVGDLYSSLEDSNDITVLGGFTQGARSVYTTFGPVTTPADFAGKKLRVQESDLHIAMAEAMGASATPMSFGELYTGLQSGVVDAAENNEPSYFTQKHYEVAPYWSYTNHLVGLDYLVINADLLAGMSDEDRAVFDEEWVAAYEEHTDLWAEATEDAIEQAEAGGATFSDVDEEAFRAVLEPLAEEFISNDTQQELYDAARAAAE